MRHLFTSLLALCLFFTGIVGCGQPPPDLPTEHITYRLIIPTEKSVMAIEMIRDIVEKANPNSDEEPEDNIKAARDTVVEILGERRVGMLISNSYGGGTVFVPYEELSERQKKTIDNWKQGYR